MVDRKFQYVAPTKKKEFIFSSIGNLNKGKDFSRLIDAFCMAFDTGDSVMLRIGGGGPEKEKLQAQIDKLGRGNQIRLLGRLDREQTILEYINCDAFALASQFETFGMVYREALVTGRPIVTTNHGGFSSDDWSDEFGIMVPVRDTYALSKALRQLYTNYSDYNGMMISQKCHEQCSADLIGDKIEMLLSNVQN
jgi:glycosyltransferase involved in cell wall biosynthesis